MMVNRFAALAAMAMAASAMWGCGSHEQRLADATTRAIYDNNIDAATDGMTPALKQQVTREQVGAISDIMHAHGSYTGLTETGTEPDGAYDFRADFSKGNFIVKMRLDGSDKIAGYRLIPQPSK